MDIELMMQAQVIPFQLHFKTPAKTSRNTLEVKKGYLLKLLSHSGYTGLGEISPFPGLSMDDRDDFDTRLLEIVAGINEGRLPAPGDLSDWPSIRFGLESALLDLSQGGKGLYFDTPFSRGKSGIPINGLVWMDGIDAMLAQAEEKISMGFRCIKFKIGAHDFDAECRMLETLRRKYSAFQVEFRTDANGAFPAADALAMLKELSRFELHSIEQPIRRGQWDELARLCREGRIPIALDEELLGSNPNREGESLMKAVRPQYLVLKPGLLGGFEICDAWIRLAERAGAGYWITSALESNLGLSAIAQYTSTRPVGMPQGLGTGQLYTDNFPSPLNIRNAYLHNDGPGRLHELFPLAQF